MRIFIFVFFLFLSLFPPVFSLLPLSLYFLSYPPSLLFFSCGPWKFIVEAKIEHYLFNASYVKWASQSHAAIAAAPENNWFRIRLPNYLITLCDHQQRKIGAVVWEISFPGMVSVLGFKQNPRIYEEYFEAKEIQTKAKSFLWHNSLVPARKHREPQIQNCPTAATERTDNPCIPCVIPKHQINFHPSVM